MARKFGKINKMSEKFEDYSYIINHEDDTGYKSLIAKEPYTHKRIKMSHILGCKDYDHLMLIKRINI